MDVWRDSEPDAGCVLEGLLVAEDPGALVGSGAIVDKYKLKQRVWVCLLGSEVLGARVKRQGGREVLFSLPRRNHEQGR